VILTVCAVCLIAAAGSAQGRVNQYSWASWYGPGLYGNGLACPHTGVLTPSTWGVANKWLPCGTRIHICYYRCVVTTVIDRGPYVAGRDFDLTYPVKQAIGMPGVARVRWWK
jgi:rare lipoprotein A